MRKLKANQNFNCSFCKQEGKKTKAIYRTWGFYYAACEAHKELGEQEDSKISEELSNPHLTEADYQTWVR